MIFCLDDIHSINYNTKQKFAKTMFSCLSAKTYISRSRYVRKSVRAHWALFVYAPSAPLSIYSSSRWRRRWQGAKAAALSTQRDGHILEMPWEWIYEHSINNQAHKNSTNRRTESIKQKRRMQRRGVEVSGKHLQRNKTFNIFLIDATVNMLMHMHKYIHKRNVCVYVCVWECDYVDTGAFVYEERWILEINKYSRKSLKFCVAWHTSNACAVPNKCSSSGNKGSGRMTAT